MARGQRKTIEEKILQKQEMINNLSARIESEQNELQALLNEQKQQEVEILYDFIKTSDMSVYEAIEVLRSNIENKYNATA